MCTCRHEWITDLCGWQKLMGSPLIYSTVHGWCPDRCCTTDAGIMKAPKNYWIEANQRTLLLNLMHDTLFRGVLRGRKGPDGHIGRRRGGGIQITVALSKLWKSCGMMTQSAKVWKVLVFSLICVAVHLVLVHLHDSVFDMHFLGSQRKKTTNVLFQLHKSTDPQSADSVSIPQYCPLRIQSLVGVLTLYPKKSPSLCVMLYIANANYLCSISFAPAGCCSERLSSGTWNVKCSCW